MKTMKRPIRNNFMTGHPQMDHNTDLANYYEALEKYVDYLEGSCCHMFIHHLKGNIFKCDDCNTIFCEKIKQ